MSPAYSFPSTVNSVGGFIGNITGTSVTQTVGNNTTAIATTAFVQAAIPVVPSPFPSGTRLLFQQTAAPTGWTKITTFDNAALRVVSGAASSGGSVNFTSAFSSQNVGGTAISVAQMPSHSHGVSDPTHSHGVSDPGHAHGYEFFGYSSGQFTVVGGVGANSNLTYTTTGATTGIGINGAGTGISIVANGSGATHTHSIDLSVKYVDTIIASKD